MKEFDYYLFIDYSENIIGYSIIKLDQLKELRYKISKFTHYKKIKNKPSYIHSIKKVIEKEKIKSYFHKIKIREMKNNMEIYFDVFIFIKMHDNCALFVSIDNHEYPNFKKFIGFISNDNIIVKKESELIRDSMEYQASLVLDTLLNIERLNKKNV